MEETKNTKIQDKSNVENNNQDNKVEKTPVFNQIFGSPLKFFIKLIVDLFGITLFSCVFFHFFGLSIIFSIIIGIVVYEIIVLLAGY